MAQLRAGSATHTGQVRPANEDNLLVADGIYIVADGMGGHEAGEVASEIAVDRIGELLGLDGGEPEGEPDGDRPDGDQPDVRRRLPEAADVVEAINRANGDIFRAAIANPGQQGMGTTVTGIAVIADPLAGRGAPNIDPYDPDAADPGGDTTAEAPSDVTPITPAEPAEALVLVNVGDSRTYLYRHDRLRRVTIDHSYVQELVATGHISEDEARTHPRRNIITRALGIEPEVRVDWWTLPLIRGDRFLLCSDGLVDEVADDDIAGTLRREDDPQAAADRLVEMANEAGGRDNITVIVIDVLEGDDPPDPTQEIDVVPVWADDTADPTPAGTVEIDADPSNGAEPPTGRTPARRRAGWRRFAVGFAVATVLVVGFVVFSVWARAGYFVTFDGDDDTVIFKGRSGGVLWIEPTEEANGPNRDDLDPLVADAIDDEPRFDSLQDAVDFVRDGVTTTTTTTTSTTTTTTVPPTTTTAPTTTVAGGTTTGP